MYVFNQETKNAIMFLWQIHEMLLHEQEMS